MSSSVRRVRVDGSMMAGGALRPAQQVFNPLTQTYIRRGRMGKRPGKLFFERVSFLIQFNLFL